MNYQKRFHSNDCNFEEDLIIPILEKLKDSVPKEDHWIIQSNTSDPNGWRSDNFYTNYTIARSVSIRSVL